MMYTMTGFTEYTVTHLTYFFYFRESPLPRSASAFENRANKKPHIDSPFVNRPSGKQKQEHSYEQDAKKNFKLIDGVR